MRLPLFAFPTVQKQKSLPLHRFRRLHDAPRVNNLLLRRTYIPQFRFEVFDLEKQDYSDHYGLFR
jgi:hypothetical protein